MARIEKDGKQTFKKRFVRDDLPGTEFLLKIQGPTIFGIHNLYYDFSCLALV